MKYRILILLLLSPVLVAASSDGKSTVEKALHDLESPFFEARRQAVLTLAGAGLEGETAMRSAYAKADFRTRALILDGFARGRPRGGIPLVLEDLDSPDRGVVLAQRRLVSAHYVGVVRYAIEGVVPRVDPWAWRVHEGLRALPGAGPTPRAAIATLLESTDPGVRTVVEHLRRRFMEVERVRTVLAEIARKDTGGKAERARALLARLLRHDTERALIAVFEVSGRDGSFDGMFATVGELMTERSTGGTPVAMAVLMAILKDRPLAESGIPPDRRMGYEFLSPLPPDGDALTMRIFAANCLGDVGDAMTGAELAEYFEEIAWNSVKEWQDEPDAAKIDDSTTPKLAVALACAALGERTPLEKRAKYLESQLRHRFLATSLERRTLAMVYARLGKHEKAAQQYQYCLEETPRDGVLWYNLACARARAGDAYAAVKALRRAVASGYGADPSQVYWAWRDRDLEPVRKLAGFKELFGEGGRPRRKDPDGSR